MFILGVTGGIGSGKSTVSSYLRDKGLLVLDADQISSLVTEAGGIALPEILEVFGPRAINAKGEMNRKYISDIVFKDKTKLDVLSSIVHKYVMDYIAEQCSREREKGTKCVVLDVPIPVRKFIELCNSVWVVTCSENVRLVRLSGRGMDREDAARRIKMQMSDEEYKKLGNFTIDNSGDISDLYAQIDKLIEEEFHSRGIRI